jgi:hypothetical protein
MRTQTIYFTNSQSPCVFPYKPSDLAKAIQELQLDGGYPVIVLIGGVIDDDQAEATQRAIYSIAEIAEGMKAIVICGGTDMGVMAAIGQIRKLKHYEFPLVGIAPEKLVAWPGGRHSTKFLWWGKKRWQLEPHYSHFILVPGSHFGDESPWIAAAAALLSQEHQSVTILINGGEISRKDIELSLEVGRPVIALSRTGRLADEYSNDMDRNKLITVVSANDEQRIIEVVQKALSVHERSVLTQSLISTM